MSRKIALLAFVALLSLRLPALAAEPWSPQHTWALVVGILEWKDAETWAPFPKTQRRDAQLVKLLEARGVPADHIVYLQDSKATRAAVIRAFHDMLAKTAAGDELVVYFCGHGHKEESGEGFLATYDAGEDMNATSWPMASVVSDIEAKFKGRRALLMADCCYSGTLAEDAEKARGPVPIACLASSSASIPSTGAWTFTESVLEGLRGGPAADLNHDGVITLDEVARYAASEMAFGDEQKSQFGTTPGYDVQEVLAKTSGTASARLGEHVEVKVDGDWWRARVIGSRPKELRVHYYGYETTDDAWVAMGDVRSRTPKQYAPNAHVMVLWKKTWYPAVVLKGEGGMHYIHYDGFAKTWDEWVDSKRIKPAS